MTMIRTRNLRLAGIRLYGKEEIQMYLFGGKGRFILKSAATGISYEYRIKQPRKTNFNGYGTIPNPKFIVSPWNNSTYEPDFNLKPLC